MTSQGFTLVELMVAMVLTAVLAIILYGLFDSTSDSLGEVSSLSQSNDEVRFAIELLRRDIETAGSLGTPDSRNDIWIQPPIGTGRVLGVTGYEDWQDDKTNFDSGANPDVSADGIVLMGAFDFPVAFEFGGMTSVSGPGQILETSRGLHKMLGIDPFRLGPSFSADFGTSTFVDQFFKNQWETRLLRIMDSEGYFQFATPDAISSSDYTTGTPGVLSVPIVTGGAVPQLRFKGPGEVVGLDQDPTGETYYDSALIDAYWYHVIPSTQEPEINLLVRDRLCASKVFEELGEPENFNPEDALAGEACGEEERTVIAERVADFQIWFECVNGSGNLQPEWTDDWETPDGGDCMTVDGTYEPHRARLAYIRLTIHAAAERPDLQHYRFEDADGKLGTAARDDAKLRTYDIVPDLQGAAPVSTMQTTVELKNYTYRL